MIPSIDFETYSEAGYLFDGFKFVDPRKNKRGLPLVGEAAYAEHPSTEIISLAYDLQDGLGVKLWVPGMPPPDDLLSHISAGRLIEAHNSQFEFYIWHFVAHCRLRWPPLPLSQLRCSMSKGKAYSLPGKLARAAQIMNTGQLKSKTGAAVMRRLSVPRKPTKRNPSLRYTPENDPEEFNALYEYNIQDVKAENALSEKIPDLSPTELKVWLLDQEINARGVHIDVESLNACINIFEQAENKYVDELTQITGGQVNGVGELKKMIEWLSARGVHIDALDESAVKNVLSQDTPRDCRRVLEIRKILSSSSVKKLYSIFYRLSGDDRLRGIFAYCGADRTGRWAGRGPQPQNLPRSGPKTRKCDPVNGCGKYYADYDFCPHCGVSVAFSESVEWGIDTVEAALADIRTGDLQHVENIWGDPLTVISGCLRGLFTAAPGHEFICSDYSAIEGVVAACLAREQWRIDVFNTHGKIYEMGASKITGIDFKEMLRHKKETGNHHPSRQKIGKVSELASGFGGWIGSWVQFGAGEFMTEQEIKKGILAWREASPNIVNMWGGQHRKHPHKWEFTPEYFGLEGAAVMAILSPGQCYEYNGIKYQYSKGTGILYCRLLSGRILHYHSAKLTPYTARNGMAEYQISYEGVDNEQTGKWITMTTYGGKLFENVVQATARDILAHAMLLLKDAGYKIVLHIHDEIVAETLEGTGDIRLFERILSTRPEWAEDWPIKATGGWIGKRYRKE